MRFHYAFEDNDFVYLVMEFCPYGDLFTLIKDKFDSISLRLKYYWFVQIALAIGRLHNHRILYRDLKP